MGGTVGWSAEAMGCRQGLLEDLGDLAVQQEQVFPVHMSEAEWLEVSVRASHWEQHLGPGVSRAGVERNGHADDGALIDKGGSLQ